MATWTRWPIALLRKNSFASSAYGSPLTPLRAFPMRGARTLLRLTRRSTPAPSSTTTMSPLTTSMTEPSNCAAPWTAVMELAGASYPVHRHRRRSLAAFSAARSLDAAAGSIMARLHSTVRARPDATRAAPKSGGPEGAAAAMALLLPPPPAETPTLAKRLLNLSTPCSVSLTSRLSSRISVKCFDSRANGSGAAAAAAASSPPSPPSPPLLAARFSFGHCTPARKTVSDARDGSRSTRSVEPFITPSTTASHVLVEASKPCGETLSAAGKTRTCCATLLGSFPHRPTPCSRAPSSARVSSSMLLAASPPGRTLTSPRDTISRPTFTLPGANTVPKVLPICSTLYSTRNVTG
mmetsp:Transcript_25581/g.84202  ORF Transcript_25581/g.84202 Transcript_25581/m.84202 type:complete len:352 (-) Transcript_25581:266-1321(-)